MKKLMSFKNSINSWLDAYKKRIDVVVACILALMPILQHYVGIIDNASTTLLLLVSPYLFIRVLCSGTVNYKNISLLFVLSVFFVYKLFDHGTNFTELAQVILMLFLFLSMAQDGIDTESVKKALTFIAAAAGACLLIQYACYYILGFHLQLVPDKALLPECKQWILGVKTGRYGINGVKSSFYRPSAFFLEPSHLFMYSFPALVLSLFGKNKKRKDWIITLLITFAIVLSTSGMGIAVTAVAWGAFFLLSNEENGTYSFKNIFRKRNLIMVGVILSVVVLAIVFVPFVRNSVIRIFSSSEGSTAIAGRTALATRELKKMTSLEWIFGVADNTKALSFNVPGFMAMAYKYGVIGIVFSYEFYVKSILKLNVGYMLVSTIIVIVSFFSAHTHGTFFMLYYVTLLMEGHRVSETSWLAEETAGIRGKIKNKFKAIKEKRES